MSFVEYMQNVHPIDISDLSNHDFGVQTLHGSQVVTVLYHVLLHSNMLKNVALNSRAGSNPLCVALASLTS